MAASVSGIDFTFVQWEEVETRHIYLYIQSVICLLFGAGQVAFNQFIRAFFAENSHLGNKVDESRKNEP